MGVGGILWGIGKFPFKAGLFLLTNVWGFMIITLILIGAVFVTSAWQSVEQGSPMPFIREVGGKLVEADTVLYMDAKDVVEQQIADPIERFKASLPLLINVWFIFVNFRIIRWLFIKSGMINDKNTPFFPQQLILVGFSMWIIQIFFSALVLNMAFSMQTLYQFIPFRGVFYWLMNIPYFITGFLPIIFDNQGKSLIQIVGQGLGLI